MPFGSASRQSRNSGNVVQPQRMPAAIARGEMSSARWRFWITMPLSASAHGASVKPQLPITTEVMPCQHDDVPSGSQKTCASMWVWPSMKPGVTTWPSASITSRARSRIRPIVAMRPCRTPTSARYPGSPEPSMTVPFLITRSYDMLSSPDLDERSEASLGLALSLGAVGDLDGLLLGVEAQGLLRLDIAAGDPDEERVVAVLDRMNIAHREHGCLARLVHEIALDLDLGVAGLAPVVDAAPPAHARRVLVVAVDHPARAVVVGHGLAALLAAVHEHVHVGLRIVADRRALAIGHRITQVLLQELGVAQQLFEVIADLGEPRRNTFRLDRGARVGEELIQRVRGVRSHRGSSL